MLRNVFDVLSRRTQIEISWDWTGSQHSTCGTNLSPIFVIMSAARHLSLIFLFFNNNFLMCFLLKWVIGTKTTVKCHLKPNVKPVFRPKRPVAYAILPLVDAELTRLKNGIISSVKYSNWASPIVVVRKSNGKIRIC